jgi:hypothetical protein
LAFARWVAAADGAGASQDRIHVLSSFLARVTGREGLWPATPPWPTTAVEKWNYIARAALLAGLIHLAIVWLICRRDSAGAGRGPSRQQGLERWANPVLILISFAFLGLTALTGGFQDYYFFLQIWREVWLGHDPWYFSVGAFGKFPMNAYGPLFNIFAIPIQINPLLPKLLCAGAYLAFAVYMIKNRGVDRPPAGFEWPLLVVWFWMPYSWIELAEFGHFDVLVGLLCAAAVEARVRQRDVLSGVCLGLGVLLKFMPVVLLPFLVLDRGRPRYRLLGAATVTIGLGMGASLLIWGPATLRPLVFAASRSSHHLSIYRFLKGSYSPQRWIGLHEDFDQAAPFLILMALAWAFRLVRRRMVEPAPAAVLAILVTLMFYQVGFAQYYMVLFVLASYWMLSARPPLREAIPIWIALGCYFAWLSDFDILLVTTGTDYLPRHEWIGLVTFLLGCLLLTSIVRAPSISRRELTAEAEPLAA